MDTKNNIKVLLIEDDAMLTDVYTTKLKNVGYDYKHAGDGERGIKMAKEFKPNVILLDIILPKKDGFTVLKSLKINRNTKNIPIILLTNLGQDDDIKKGLELGAESYLTKANCTPAEVIQEIEKVLN